MKALKNVAASVHQRLLNLARQTGRPFNELAQYYALERWLYRLAQSDYRNLFILKGALMLLVWKMPVTRPTRDIDLLGRVSNDLASIREVIASICQIPTKSDGMVLIPGRRWNRVATCGRMNDLRSARYVSGLRLEFDDGLEGDVDLSSYLGKGPIFAPLAELSYFKQFTLERNPRLAERSRYRARAALRNDGKCEPRGRANAPTHAAIGRRRPILLQPTPGLLGDSDCGRGAFERVILRRSQFEAGTSCHGNAVFLHFLPLGGDPTRSWECSSLFPLPQMKSASPKNTPRLR